MVPSGAPEYRSEKRSTPRTGQHLNGQSRQPLEAASAVSEELWSPKLSANELGPGWSGIIGVGERPTNTETAAFLNIIFQPFRCTFGIK